MVVTEKIYILGCGAIGFPLAAYLTAAGKSVVAVRVSKTNVSNGQLRISVHTGKDGITVAVETISLSALTDIRGTIVIATKAYANKALALGLKDKGAIGPVVILQNGLAVEKPFLDAGFSQVYRCVLYVTSQA